VTSAKRSLPAPQIPSVAESGIAGYDTSGWFGLVVSAATPRAIAERLNSIVVKGVSTTDVRECLGALGGDVIASSITESSAYMRADHAKWAKVAAAASLRDKP